ncbi:MAG: Fe-S cluster assembly protein SufD [Bacteroidota bacterium]
MPSLLTSQAQQAIDKHFSTLAKPHPFYEAKQQAWQAFRQLSFPGPKDEAYKYTPITNTLAGVFDLSQDQTTSQLTQAELRPWFRHEPDAYQLVLINGQLSKVYSTLGSPEHPWQCLTFADAYQQHQAALLQHWRQPTPEAADAFAALNTALFEEGILIHIADHAVLDKPLFIYHIADASTHPRLTYPRLRIVLGEHSQASLVTAWHTLGQHPGFTNAVTEIKLASNARLDYHTLQTQMGHQAYQVNTTQCYQASQSVLNTYTLTWDGAFVRNNLHTHLYEPYGEANMYGLYCLDNQQHVDNHTLVDHQAPHTQSNERYKGIITGQATGVFNGKIYVRAEAQNTNAFQANNNVVLSDQATIHTKPQLEIWADDVKCSHGATVGQLDEAQLFYLSARGIPLHTARYMLLNAFASDVIATVASPVLKSHIHQALETRLSTLGLEAASNTRSI